MSAFSIQIPLPFHHHHHTSLRLGKAEMPSFSSPLPNLQNPEELCSFLNLSEFALKRFVFRSRDFYRVYQRNKKSGEGKRKISAPLAELKTVQRKIKVEILDKVEAHVASTGYRRGSSIVANAQVHVGKRAVFNLDIQDFFESINTARVAGLFLSFGYPEKVALILARLCTFDNALPQGAPSSPALANLVCHKLDRRISGLAKARNMSYTRYCDDISISGDGPFSPALLELVRKIISEEGLAVNPHKTRLLTRRSCQIVTGLTVNEKVNIPRRRRKQIRAVFHKAASNGASPECSFKNYLCGLSAYLHMVKVLSAGKKQ